MPVVLRVPQEQPKRAAVSGLLFRDVVVYLHTGGTANNIVES